MPPEMDQDTFLINRRQEIFIGKHSFEFSQDDNIFKLSRPVVPHEELGNGKTKKTEKLIPLSSGSCFCCKEHLTSKVK
jgi:organic hydroperoxide reductase OsmC/OhrA